MGHSVSPSRSFVPAGAPGSRPTVMVQSAAYDEANARLFYATSNGTNLDLWEWDGVDWTQRTTPTTPPARAGAGAP